MKFFNAEITFGKKYFSVSDLSSVKRRSREKLRLLDVFFSETCKKDRCIRYEILKKGLSIKSESGTYKMLVNETGNLEIWCKHEMVWYTYTFDKYIEFLYLGSQGLYLLGKDGSNRLNGALIKLKQKVDFLIIRNDGNLVIFDENGGIAWKYMPEKKMWYVVFFLLQNKFKSIDSFS